MYDRQYEDLVYSSWEWRSYTSWLLNPWTPKILLVILLPVCYTILVMLVWRIWYRINFSPYNITPKSYIKVTKIKEMITKKKETLDGWKNSPCQHLRKFIENSMENMQTDLIVFGQM